MTKLPHSLKTKFKRQSLKLESITEKLSLQKKDTLKKTQRLFFRNNEDI